MNKSTYRAAAGGLLHDVGKLCYRAGDGRSHSVSGAELAKRYIDDKDIIDCIRFHHAKELRSANIAPDSPAYAVYIADNIAAGADRRDSAEDMSGFDPRQPLASVFDTMSGKSEGFYAANTFSAADINYPQPKSAALASQEKYAALLHALTAELERLPFSEEYVDSLLSIIESVCCYAPSSTSQKELPDISLYDHSRLTAGVASCISEYMLARGETDWRRLFTDTESFYKENAFLLFSADLSGIQNFIYSVVSKGAMKSLKSRSASLELLMENYIDELLDMCGLSRACLIYSGGGHCYILLPNTEAAKENISALQVSVRRWLIEHFGSGLYIAADYVETDANTLMNKMSVEDKDAELSPLALLFRELGRKLGENKLRRYTADEIRLLNSGRGGHERECKNCGRSDRLGEGDLCDICRSFEEIAKPLSRPESVMLVTKEKPDAACIELPSRDGTVYMSFPTESEARRYLADGGDVVRVYSKNKPYTGMKYARNIFIGDYSYNHGGSLEDLADAGEGIKRISVLRADVDNLGAAFISGFVRPEGTPEQRFRYDTLSRKAAFSRQMSVFFRCFINILLESSEGITLYDRKDGEKRKKAAVVYSGGDDLFIVGSWADVLESAIYIRDSFMKFCGEALTLSAGIGIYEVKYPILKSAGETGELEDAAKDLPGKDAVALFDDDICCKWAVLNNEIIGEKVRVLRQLMGKDGVGDAMGKSMLYKMTLLLRGVDAEKKDRIDLARFAYLLARLASRTKNKADVQRELTRKLYGWAVDKKQREQLITAIYIYIYLVREAKNNAV